MSKLDTLLANGGDPAWWRAVALPWLAENARTAPVRGYAALYYALSGVDFVSIPDADWDNLLVLDACRYDSFAAQQDLPGTLEKRYSKAPNTPTFLRRNFKGGVYHDTVYVTGNPHVEQQLSADTFHEVYHVWRTHWDEELKTVHPEALREVALEAAAAHPNKRLIVHFMQPHLPFIGDWAREHVGIHLGNEHSRQGALYGSHDLEMRNPYTLLENEDLSPETVERAYVENLEVALEAVADLLEDIEGRSVVTGDHGELFGERAWPFPWRAYQHPPLPAKKLLEVPWLVVDDGARRAVEAEPPTETTDDVSGPVSERLRHLGYRE